MISQLLKEGVRSSTAKNNYMHPHTNRLYALFMEFEEQSGEEFNDLFKIKELPKGTYLLKEGEISTKCYFIKSGIARSFQIRGKREMTMFFGFPNEFIDSYQSSALKVPSTVSIQLLSDSVVYEFSWCMLNKYKFRYPIIWKIEELIIVCLLSAFENRLVDMQEKNATERYEELLVHQPQLVKSVSLTHIANYIGCTAECISRIRAKISCRKSPIFQFR
jgi:CRP-like cAMP-binding protein